MLTVDLYRSFPARWFVQNTEGVVIRLASNCAISQKTLAPSPFLPRSTQRQ